MNLQTGLDVAFYGTTQIGEMNNINDGSVVPAYFQLSDGIYGCRILNDNGEITDDGSGNLQAYQAIISNSNPDLSIGFYHFLYDPNYVQGAMSCYEQGVVFGQSLANNNIVSTQFLLMLDIEGACFGLTPGTSTTIPLSEIESCVSDFMNGLAATISGNYEVMIYSNLNFINNISNPPMYESSQLTDSKLWMAAGIYEETPFGYEPTNEQIETAINEMNSITWGGVTGWSAWQYGQSWGNGNGLNIDLDLFNLDVVQDSSMYYNLIN